jgi:hypothetical protein
MGHSRRYRHGRYFADPTIAQALTTNPGPKIEAAALHLLPLCSRFSLNYEIKVPAPTHHDA